MSDFNTIDNSFYTIDKIVYEKYPSQKRARRLAVCPSSKVAQKIAAALNFHIGGIRMSCEPAAIIEHFDGEKAGELLREAFEADPGEARNIAWGVLDGLYDAFHDGCVEAFYAATDTTYPPEEDDDE